MIVLRHATLDDAPAVAAIHNQGIAARGATFDTEPRTPADAAARIRDGRSHPQLVAVDGGTVVGWAGLSPYRSRACYAGIAEVSVYVDTAARGRGIGSQLLRGVVEAAADAGFWKLVSRVFPFNNASRAACRAAGFREVGTYEKHARLDGRWLDVVIVERLIHRNLIADQDPNSGTPVTGGDPATHPNPAAEAAIA
ncbi:arsinothricin resistance N-acetyltransferase ArsN1 family A [Lysobacter sp. A3-1-A15]|uniref:arsinothricin resistance N-acetyltransferase ArsN1 family A n=1 Tax=Novilysobacter viscosus TaxID=3098602 RepID=UPI002ED7D3C5